MASAVPLIRSSLLAEFPALVRDLGGPLDTILEEAGLGLERIEQPALLIPFHRQVRLLQLAAEHCDCEEFSDTCGEAKESLSEYLLGARSQSIRYCYRVRRHVRRLH